MTKNTILIITCAALAAISIGLAFALYQKPRFVPARGNSPYVMFDNKTAQACWSGGGDESTDPFLKSLGVKNENPPHLPFCKDLK